MPLCKYFLAIIIPEPYQTQVTELKKYVAENYQSKAAMRSPAHITLHMPFEWKEEKEDKLIDALKEFTFHSSFNIELKNFSCFEPRVIFIDVLQNAHLNELQKKLVQHVKQNLHVFNQADDKRGFRPHATIAFRDLKKEKFQIAWPYFKAQTIQASFKTESFCLLKHTGAVWEEYAFFTY